PMFTTADGRHTNAVYGFFTMLLRLLEEEKPSHLAVAFDAGAPTFRHEAYAAYKAGRRETASELREQFPLLRRVLEAWDIPIVELAGYEADDVIGTLATRAEEAGGEVLVVTGDRDAFQLVSKAVRVIYTRRGITEVDRVDESYLRERYGLAASQIPDLKGLMGDASDNIPGVPGIGEKTALRLLGEFGTVEDLLEHMDELARPKERELLATHAEEARRSKQLATIDRAVPLNFDLEACRRREPDWGRIRRIFTELEFKSLLGRLPQGGAPAPAVEARESEAPIRLLAAGDSLEGLWPPEGRELYWQLFAGQDGGLRALAWLGPGGACYLPLSGALPREAAARLCAGRTPAICHDAKTHLSLLAGKEEIPLEPVFDTMVASYLVNPALAGADLSVVAGTYLQRSLPGPGPKYDPLAEKEPLPPGEGARIAASRLAALLPAREALTARLHEDGLWHLFSEVEMPLTLVLLAMERAGIAVDLPFLAELGREMAGELAGIEAEIHALAGKRFNLNSPKQLASVLFGDLGLPARKRTKTGFSTDVEVLEELAAEHPVVARILDYRGIAKLKSTYVDALQALADPATGRVHTTFNQAVTATGRLSSTEPNLQNIPVRTEEGRRIRRAFVAGGPERVLLAADYSQIELRVLAHFSNDQDFMAAFREGDDIHRRTAAEVFGVPEEAVTPVMRNRAKAVNFGIIYGQGGFGLAKSIGVGVGEAEDYIRRYFQRYEGVRAYLDRAIAEARERKYVTTLLGRRRYLPDLASQNRVLRAYAERTARNTPIQGTAADIIKVAMVRVHRRLQRENFSARLILQVHDELIFEAPQVEVHALAAMAREEMENAAALAVPLEVEVKAGSNWLEMKKVDRPA
ncbi:MAG: DNA polymerase I, partial [Patescibacteria group bacterium]